MSRGDATPPVKGPRHGRHQDESHRGPGRGAPDGGQRRQRTIAREADLAALEDLPSASPSPLPHSGNQSAVLRAIYGELRRLRASLSAMQRQISRAAPVQSRRAVSIDAAQELLGCGRTRIYELLRNGALRRAPKVGKSAMIRVDSLEAFLEGLHREPVLKQPRARRKSGQEEAEAILKLIRSS